MPTVNDSLVTTIRGELKSASAAMTATAIAPIQMPASWLHGNMVSHTVGQTMAMAMYVLTEGHSNSL